MSNPQSTVLICDDEAGFRGVIAELLEDDGYHVLTAGSLEQGRALLADVSPDVAVVDLRLPDGDGIDLLRDMATLAPECLCLIVTAHASLQSAVTALRLGAHDYLEKPFQLDDLVRKVELMSRYRAVQRENAALRNLVARRDVGVQTYGRTRAMTQLLDQAARVAARGRLALITGESGSGKEVLARYIHAHSPHADRPFVPVNLGALPDTMAEAQLFGHVKGAFTSADRSSEGLVRAAAGGTLFLDEITEATGPVQTKLLRLLDSAEVLPVGATQPVRVQCLTLAATNRDIAAEVAAGRFRADLLHRLDVVRLTLPPLRDQRETIPHLARQLLASLAAQRAMPVPTIAADAMQALIAYSWPGNVRELRNVLERAVILGPGDVIHAGDLPADLQAFVPDAGDDTDPADLRHAVAAFERAHIRQVVEACAGDRRAAAGRLGIGLATLYRKLNDQP